MEWKDWNGKKVFVQLRTGSVYSGKVIGIDDAGNGLVFINLLDKFSKHIVFTTGEIVKIVEEE